MYHRLNSRGGTCHIAIIFAVGLQNFALFLSFQKYYFSVGVAGLMSFGHNFGDDTYRYLADQLLTLPGCSSGPFV